MHPTINAINTLVSIMQLLNNLGIDAGEVAHEIQEAHDEGKTLSQYDLKQLAKEWKKTDAAEQQAYEQRMSDPKV